MTDFTVNWLWPQWTMFAWLFISFGLAAMKHGQPRLQENGPEKGQPEKVNAFLSASRIFGIVFILICGGFFA